MTTHVVGRRLAGLVFFVVLSLLVWLSVAVYNKDFTSSTTVTLETASVGNEMHPYAEVKLRGVVVGEVREISADGDGDGARLELALDPDKASQVPANVSAQMLPTTLFGERFVALVPPAEPAAEPLAAGDVIAQDRTENAIELEEVLDDVLPVLTAVKPQKLSATLTAMSQALDGRGDQLGDNLVQLDEHLEDLNPQLPTLNRDIEELVDFAELYAEAAPDVIDALQDAITTSATVAEQRKNLSELYGGFRTSSQNLDTFLEQNQDNIIDLSGTSRPTVELLARYSPSFPCTLRALRDFVPVMDKALGKGTRKPGLRASVTVVPQRGKYVPGRDTPSYDAGGGPRCYGVPYTGAGAGTPARAASAGPAEKTVRKAPAGTPGELGLPNSPEENQLVNELLAPSLEERPDRLPDWTSVLAAPVFRGTEVELK